MGCRIGMTTDLEARKAYWSSVYPNLQNWTVLLKDLTKEEAQEDENMLSLAHSCESSPGGDDSDDPNAKWFVYKFDF